LPIYEYKCEGCGETFEVIQKFADEPVAVHEKCGAPVHRLMSAPAFQFKGTGWYVTDYAKGGNVPAKGESGKGETGKGESGKSESGKSDSGKSDSGGSDSSSKSTDTATKTASKSESKPASSSGSSSKND
jgi:putative FmdB family regulatory protein